MNGPHPARRRPFWRSGAGHYRSGAIVHQQVAARETSDAIINRLNASAVDISTSKAPATFSPGEEAMLRQRLSGRKVACLYLNFGPYHVARLRAIAAALRRFDARLVAIELAGEEKIYPWRVARDREAFEWRTLVSDRPVERIPGREQARLIRAVFDECQPAGAIIPGWSHAFHRAAAGWCRRRRALSVVCGDTTAGTRRKGYSQLINRAWYIEWYKRWLFRGFTAAVASGDLCREYFASLGMPRERIFLKYDVVDNAFFARIADETRAQAQRWRAELRTPERFFFFPSRLLPLKNHLRLMDAYLRYREQAGASAWGLVLVGSGPTEAEVDAKIQSSGSADVQRRPFAQIEEVARFYGLASCMILPSWSETWGLIVNEACAAGLPVLVSRNCPVSEHLVCPGVNGWTFDPFDVEDMASKMLQMTALSEESRAALGQASRRVAADWDVDDHAHEGLRALACGDRR